MSFENYYICHENNMFKNVTVLDENGRIMKPKNKLSRPPEKFKSFDLSFKPDLLYSYNYTKNELHEISKTLGIKFKKMKTMKKESFIHHLFNMIRIQNAAKVIRKLWERYFIKKYNSLLGPTYLNYQLSNNVEDFLTMEDIKEIEYDFFLSYQDEDGFNYTFNLISLYNLVQKKMMYNPYNRKSFPNHFILNLNKKIKYNKILMKKHRFVLEKHRKMYASFSLPQRTIPPIQSSSAGHTSENQPVVNYTPHIREIFMTIDNLGNYTQAEWFLSLSPRFCRQFLFELKDIWIYRAQISRNIKIQIYPPHGNPFYDIDHTLNINSPLPYIHQKCYLVMNRMLNRCQDQELRRMSALYILTALTIVSPSAASALPWLYESTQ